MDDGIPGAKEARYRLLGLQAVPYEGGVIVRRGTDRLYLRGEGAGALFDLIVERSAEGGGIDLDRLRDEVDPSRHEVLDSLLASLRAARLLVPASEDVRDERREEVFYWNRGTTLAATLANLETVSLAVLGINHVSLPLLGNLRGCGFRRLTLVDHPGLRNVDFFNDRQELRAEIAAAMSVKPQPLDTWQAGRPKPDCQIVCSDFGGLALMRDFNRAAVAAGMLFYPIVLQDEVARLGPLVVPGEGPCFECLWRRQDANLRDPEFGRATEAHAFFGQAVSGYLQPMARVAADIAAVELLKFFGRTLPGGAAGRLIEADLMAPSLATRTVLKLPRCPVCASAGRPAEPEGRA